jgi:hypothetical protein
MDTLLSILIGLAAVMFVLIAIAFLAQSIRTAIQEKKPDTTYEDLGYDYVPSRTMATRKLIWEDRRAEERRNGRDRREKPNESVQERERRREKDRRDVDRRSKLKMRPPYPTE